MGIYGIFCLIGSEKVELKYKVYVNKNSGSRGNFEQI